MNKITAITVMLASRWFRKTAPTRLRTLERGRPPGAAPRISGLRSAVSLTSLIPIVLLRPVPVRGESYPGAAAIHLTSLSVNRRGPALPSVARSGDQVEIAPVCFSYFCALVEPSNRVVGEVYAAALLLVTNVRPVWVVAGFARPPDSCHR